MVDETVVCSEPFDDIFAEFSPARQLFFGVTISSKCIINFLIRIVVGLAARGAWPSEGALCSWREHANL